MSSIEERVKKIVVEQLGVKEDQVSPQASFVDDLGADSLDTVELVMALEEEFECEIPDEEAEKITTVGQAISYIKEHLPTPERQGSCASAVVIARWQRPLLLCDPPRGPLEPRPEAVPGIPYTVCISAIEGSNGV